MSISGLCKLVGFGIDTAITAAGVGVVALFDENFAYLLCRAWAHLNLVLFRIQVRTTRRGPIDPGATYVFMSNHQSQLDILAVMAALPEFQLRWVAKRELTRIPVFGWALQKCGHIIVDRGNHDEAIARLQAASARTREGISVIIFPEGTRTRSPDVLLPFKKGGFMLALDAGVPIVPVAVRGSFRLLPPHTRDVHGGDIDVIVGAQIPTVGTTREELERRVRAFMCAELGVSSVDIEGLLAARAS